MFSFACTSGNWDIKTQAPHQCSVSKMKLPDYFMEWINIKDVYLNFYNKKVPYPVKIRVCSILSGFIVLSAMEKQIMLLLGFRADGFTSLRLDRSYHKHYKTQHIGLQFSKQSSIFIILHGKDLNGNDVLC